MSQSVAYAMAKIAASSKALRAALKDGATGRAPLLNYAAVDVGHFFSGANAQISILKDAYPELYGDFRAINETPRVKMSDPAVPNRYHRDQLEMLVRDLDQIIELRANSTPAASSLPSAAPQRVFITHGRSKDWLEVQAFIEKDKRLPTIELAQEPNGGMTIIEKLEAAAAACDSAVIVMTGDDVVGDHARARENVMHEIGFFQGLYGRQYVVLLHEEGANVPTNLAGIAYIPYPSGSVSSGFHVLA